MVDLVLHCEASSPQSHNNAGRVHLDLARAYYPHMCTSLEAPAGCRSVVCSSMRRNMPKRAVTGDTLESTGKSLLT
jgi:hypothetical protein